MFWKVRAMPSEAIACGGWSVSLRAPAGRGSDLAGGGGVDAADQVEHRGLAGAVGADQREHLAAPHVEAHVVDRQHAAEAHAEVFG
jgi:hypothetical protein